MEFPTDDQISSFFAFQRYLVLRRCRVQGHNFQVLSTLSGIPKNVMCSRCGKLWKVLIE